MKKLLTVMICALAAISANAQFKFKSIDTNDGKTTIVIVDDNFKSGSEICCAKFNNDGKTYDAKSMMLCACSSHRRVDGWYPVADYPDNSIVGKPLATVSDFEDVVLVRDTFVIEGDTVTQMLIQGRVSSKKRRQWADGTERLNGKRLGFVYKDSVISAPQINTRIESGSFQIFSPDTTLLNNIYHSITEIQK